MPTNEQDSPRNPPRESVWPSRGYGAWFNTQLFHIVPRTIVLLLQMPSWPLLLPKGYQCLITCGTTIGDRSK